MTSIKATEWKPFIDAFSRSHDGWAASLEVRESGQPIRTEVDDSPFRGATVEKHEGRDTIVLTFGYEPEEHFARIIHDPRSLVAGGGEVEASLVVEGSDGSRCTLTLRNPLREEELYRA